MTDTTNGSDASPFRDGALTYFRRGWTDVFPMGFKGGPRYAKEPVPKGVTGYDAKPVGYARIRATIETPAGLRNLGIRMPRHIICLDVDEYEGHHGLATLRAAEVALGDLPATYRNSARGLTESGHRYFRLPVGYICRPGAEEILDAAYGKNIEILHYGRRYAVAWPSLNPHAGLAPYLWYGPDGQTMSEPPAVVDIPLLPERWVETLAARTGSPEAERGRCGNLRAATVREQETGDELMDEPPALWRRSVMEQKALDHLRAVLAMTDGVVNKTLGSAGIAYATYADAGLFTLDQAKELIVAATVKNGVHSDDWNHAHRRKWTLDTRVDDALSQGLNRKPILLMDDVAPVNAYAQLLKEIQR